MTFEYLTATMTNNEIGSVKTAFQILETIKKRESVGVTDLSKALDIPKSTTFSHLNTLSNKGYLIVEDGQYRLALSFLDLGHNARTNSELFEVAKPKIDDLADQTGEVANLMTEENGQGVYLYITLGEKAVRFDTYPGKKVPLYSTALGKAILAHMTPERRDECLRPLDLVPIAENTITDIEELQDEIEQVRDQGYALDREERAPGLRCVAAPIVDEKHCVGALSVAAPLVRMQEERFTSELPEKLKHTASEIELSLRYP